ncbi:MAG: hypothetical protein HYW05_04570 [Candidatus Diapherotrites archaeon]|nr:hypothetical protein [Candidatus Diapherotrites archaeon]
MNLTQWKLKFKPGWDMHFRKFDKPIRQQIIKKIEKMKQPLAARGLHSSSYQVEEVGQYRIAFMREEETRTKHIHFVGNHKQYENWYSEQ